MSDTIEVQTPSGTWTLSKRLNGRQLRQIDALAKAEDNIYEAIAFVTVSWPFSEDISAEAMDEMDAEELIPVLTAFNDEVLPFLQKLSERLGGTQLNGSQPSSTRATSQAKFEKRESG